MDNRDKEIFKISMKALNMYFDNKNWKGYLHKEKQKLKDKYEKDSSYISRVRGYYNI